MVCNLLAHFLNSIFCVFHSALHGPVNYGRVNLWNKRIGTEAAKHRSKIFLTLSLMCLGTVAVYWRTNLKLCQKYLSKLISSLVYFHSISHYNQRMRQFEIGRLSDTLDFIGGGRGGAALHSHQITSYLSFSVNQCIRRYIR